jgi:RNA recognition motif-containing protein
MPITVFVDGLPPHFKSEHLRKLVTPFGEVKQSFVAIRRSGRSLCFGYVTFSNLSEARQAVDALNGAEIMGKTLTLYVSDSGSSSSTSE